MLNHAFIGKTNTEVAQLFDYLRGNSEPFPLIMNTD